MNSEIPQALYEKTLEQMVMVYVNSLRIEEMAPKLNDEAMNMMQYQKAYTAACRLMTAVDEALDRLINNTGIAGR